MISLDFYVQEVTVTTLLSGYFNYDRKQRPHSKLVPHCDAAVPTHIKRLCLDQKSANCSTQSHQGKDSSRHGVHTGRDSGTWTVCALLRL